MLRSRSNGIGTKTDRTLAGKLLRPAEEDGLLIWLNRAQSLRMRITHLMIENEVNRTLLRRQPLVDITPNNITRCGQQWVQRFLEKHPEFTTRIDTPKELYRETAENRENLTAWFEELRLVIEEHGVLEGDTYNYDETGVRLGVGKKEKVVVSTSRARVESGTTTNRESCTVGECISGDGFVMPPLIILKGKQHQTRWSDHSSIPDDYWIEVNETAYMNDQLALDWVKLFEKWSRNRRVRGWRLLILDGHTTHGTREVIEFCDAHNILIFCMLPHTTHLCQPLDVRVFQQYKHWYGKAVSRAYSTGCTDHGKMEFLNAIRSVRMLTFKPTTIMSGWKAAGIIPFNPMVVIEQCPVTIARTPERDLFAEPTTPTNWAEFNTPQSSRSLWLLGNHVKKVWEDEPAARYYNDMFMRASNALAHAAICHIATSKQPTPQSNCAKNHRET